MRQCCYGWVVHPLLLERGLAMQLIVYTVPWPTVAWFDYYCGGWGCLGYGGIVIEGQTEASCFAWLCLATVDGWQELDYCKQPVLTSRPARCRAYCCLLWLLSWFVRLGCV